MKSFGNGADSNKFESWSNFVEKWYFYKCAEVLCTEKKIHAKLQHSVLVKIMPTHCAAFLQGFAANFKHVCSKITAKRCKNTTQGVGIIFTVHCAIILLVNFFSKF